LVVVDNASAEPLQESELNQGRSLPLRIVREPIPGLGRARVTGISASRGDVLVFVDDDNFLDPDYLQRALEIAQSEPRIGLFGGISTAELGGPMAGWKAEILPHLGIRNHGDQPITRFSDRWGEWEPIGAGMVARRAVAERFVKMFNEIPEARLLGRSGSALLSGEDSLFARAAFREGFACSYQPVLKLTHYLKASRLTFDYLSRVLEGHGRSYVILHRAMGKPVDPLPWRTRIARWIYRVRKHGRAGLILARWERGYAKEMTSPTQTPALRYSEEPGLAAKEPGPSAYLRTGVGNDTNRLEATSHPV
jgi:glycosyltransferase involved in cell wall biosynthesis